MDFLQLFLSSKKDINISSFESFDSYEEKKDIILNQMNTIEDKDFIPVIDYLNMFTNLSKLYTPYMFLKIAKEFPKEFETYNNLYSNSISKFSKFSKFSKNNNIDNIKNEYNYKYSNKTSLENSLELFKFKTDLLHKISHNTKNTKNLEIPIEKSRLEEYEFYNDNCFNTSENSSEYTRDDFSDDSSISSLSSKNSNTSQI